MLLFWMRLRSWGWGPNTNQLLESMRQWQQVWLPLFQGLEQLRTEVPLTAEILAPKQLGFALRWKLTMERVEETVSQLAQHPDVQAFFARHPDLFSPETKTTQEKVKEPKETHGVSCNINSSLPP